VGGKGSADDGTIGPALDRMLASVAALLLELDGTWPVDRARRRGTYRRLRYVLRAPRAAANLASSAVFPLRSALLQPMLLLLLGTVASCIAAPAFVGAGTETGVRVAVAVAFFCLAPGLALLSLSRRGLDAFELAVVLAFSMGLLALAAEGMLALHIWHPRYATYVLAAVCLPPLSWNLLRALGFSPGSLSSLPRRSQELAEVRPRDGSNTAAVPASMRLGGQAAPLKGVPHMIADDLGIGAAFDRTSLSAATRTNVVVAHGGLLAAAIGCWIAALDRAEIKGIGGYGLVSALPALYYVAIGLLCVGFASAVSSRTIRAGLPLGYIVALIVVLHGTAAALYREPRYPYVYKHIGVIDFIAAHGFVDRHTDIYNNWPGFFALNAWFKYVAGVSPLAYAPWAQIFFEIANVAALLFVVRALTSDERLKWIAIWIFVASNWVGQDYLAPQAFGFLLVLVVLGLCIRYAPAPVALVRSSGRRNVLARTRRLVVRAWEHAPSTSGPAALSSPGALVVGSVCSLAVVISHQLSPIVLILGMAGLWLTTGRIKGWIVLGLAGAEAGWVALAWPFVNRHFNVLTFDLLPHPHPTGNEVTHPLPGVNVVANMSRGLVSVVVLLALLGALFAWRSRRFDPTVLTLVAAPLPVVVAQSYGGEIVFRAFLFGLPWLALLAANCFNNSQTSRSHTFIQALPLLGVSGVLLTGFLFSYFGLEKINYVTRDDIAATDWYEQRAPAGSVMAYLTPNFLAGITADYTRVRVYGRDYVPILTNFRAFRRHPLSVQGVREIVTVLRNARAPHAYFVLSPVEWNFVELFGIMPRDSPMRLLRLLESSPQFRLVYRYGRAYIFELKHQPIALAVK
jgi:hypothetical protein